MKKILAIDIGNTNITFGVFAERRLVKRSKVPTYGYSAHTRCFKNLMKKYDVSDIIISSVVPLVLARLVCCLGSVTNVHVKIIGRDVKVPAPNLYRNKSEVGADRLVNAYAAAKFYGAPSIVIDFGTAITFDVISKKGYYLGGLILPGIEMGLSGLHQKTALLPKVKLRPAKSIIGKDTVNSMRGGILFGYGAMCDGLVEKYKKTLGKNMKVIATGGNAKLIKRYTKSIRIVDEDLALKGLSLIASC